MNSCKLSVLPTLRYSQRVLAVVIAATLLGALQPARATTNTNFAAGSLIIPMDVDFQNAGMLRAFGLLYRLLLAGVPVNWVVLPGKTLYTGTTANPASPGNSVDFVASATDTRTGATITNHGYRGGPFVIDAADRTAALAVITPFTTANPNVAVHSATAAFIAPVSRVLVNAPNIGINADGNENIAFGYLNAAGIPDSKGQAWPGAKQASYPGFPDIMTPEQVAGPTTSSHSDGSLFGPTGLPRYCQLMSMHWTVDRSAAPEETLAEMKQFLTFPTHLFAECQAVNQIEDSVNGHFVSTDNGTGEPIKSIACFKTPDNGLCAAPQPTTVKLLRSDLPFAQFDGAFKTVGGSEPAYGLSPGSTYYSKGIVMMQAATATDFGQADLWMTGVAGGGCNIIEGQTCANFGKVSYLGGHSYTTATPILSNPTSQGTRLFLNSLFEAACTTSDGQPNVLLSNSSATSTSSSLFTFTFDFSNGGPGVAVGGKITQTLPAGATFVSATAGGTFSGGVVTWNISDLAANDSGSVSVTVQLNNFGSFNNQATLTYQVGNSTRTVTSSQTTTSFQPAPDMAMGGTGLCAGVTCSQPPNPCQQSVCNPANGMCMASNAPDGTGCSTGNKCQVGETCTAGVCGGGIALQCPVSSNPCQANTCSPNAGCVTSNLADNTACSTGNKCKGGEVCRGGICQGGSSVSCPASLDTCQSPSCDPAIGCGFVPVVDGTPCTTSGNGMCITGATCAAGICSGGSGMSCPPPSGPCTIRVCTPNPCDIAFAPAGTDPNGDCAPVGACANACDGNGGCLQTCVGPAMGCTADAQCSTGHCADTVCCATACSGVCQACNINGQLGTCTAVPDGTDPRGDCGAGKVCNGSGACRDANDQGGSMPSGGGSMPSGCGCQVGAADRGTPSAAIALLAAALVFILRSRRRHLA